MAKKSLKVTDKDVKKILAMIDQGKSRNEIAAKTGWSRATITNVVKREGYSGRVAQANQQNAANHRALADTKRQALRGRLIDQAHKMIDRLEAPCNVYAFGGKDNEFNEHELSAPDHRATRDYATSVGILVDKIAVLEKRDQEATEGGQLGAMLKLLDAMGVKPDSKSP